MCVCVWLLCLWVISARSCFPLCAYFVFLQFWCVRLSMCVCAQGSLQKRTIDSPRERPLKKTRIVKKPRFRSDDAVCWREGCVCMHALYV